MRLKHLRASQMSEEQWQFLEGEFLTLTVDAAIGHGTPTYVPNPTPEQRIALGRALRNGLRRLVPRYSGVVDEQEHVQNIKALASDVASHCAPFLVGGRLRFGRAQKALNLYLKYLWCAGRIPVPPHCPFDTIVIERLWARLPPEYRTASWTAVEDDAPYLAWVSAASKVAGPETLADWELRVWTARASR